MKIAVYDTLTSELFDRLKNALPEHEFYQLHFTELLDSERETWESIEYAIGPRLVEEVLHVAKNLKVLQVPWVGVDFLDFSLLEKYQVTICNAKWNNVLVAEYALALLFAVAKKLVIADREFREGNWSPREYSSVQLTGKKALLIGFGAIGQTIARFLSPYDMTMYALKREVTDVPPEFKALGVETVISWDEYLSYAPTVDFVIMALPLTPETEGIMNHERLQALKNGAILVNVGRGKTIDEEALFTALKNGPLSGAGIDVWYKYPRKGETTWPVYPSKFPFHELSNIVMSPHRAASFYDAPENFWDDVIYNIQAFTNGNPLRNVVPYHRKY